MRTDDQWQKWKFPQLVAALRKWTVRNPPKCDDVEVQGKQFKPLTKPPYKPPTKLPQSRSFQANQREVKRRPRVYYDKPNRTHRQTVITSRRSPSEESYLFKSNYVLTAPVQITELRSAAALRNVHTAEGDTTHPSARTSLDTKDLSTWEKNSVTYPVVVVEVCGIRCRTPLDTGAGSSYASAALLDRIGKQPVRKEFRNIEILM